MNSLSKPRDIDYECINRPTYEDYVENNYQTIGCGSLGSSIAMFYSFVVIIMLIFLNLFIAIILQGYQDN
jgi:hypothetical protein